MEKIESYIYLGEINDHLFFVNMITNNDIFNKELSYQIYNCMISHKFIKMHTKNVVIFDADKINGTINVVSIQHIDNAESGVYGKQDMEDNFMNFINSSRDNNELYMIIYKYKEGSYNPGISYSELLNNTIINMLQEILKIKKFMITNIDYVKTSKPIK